MSEMKTSVNFSLWISINWFLNNQAQVAFLVTLNPFSTFSYHNPGILDFVVLLKWKKEQKNKPCLSVFWMNKALFIK